MKSATEKKRKRLSNGQRKNNRLVKQEVHKANVPESELKKRVQSQ